jgi:hypothetical protein
MLFALCITISGQTNYFVTHNDSLALENVIVEHYYVADSTDCADSTGGVLPKGSITYRIYIDMKPGYSLQTVYGSKNHELFFKTSTTFFNNTVCSALSGFNIDVKVINKNTVALDSWITMGAASRLHTGVMKDEDNDGSVLNREALKNTDGLTKGIFPTFKLFNIDLSFFNDEKNATYFTTHNGAWAALGGVKGPTPENRVLIAQLTTNGKLSFNLNIQMGTPTGGTVRFVAKNQEVSEIQFNALAHN